MRAEDLGSEVLLGKLEKHELVTLKLALREPYDDMLRFKGRSLTNIPSCKSGCRNQVSLRDPKP